MRHRDWRQGATSTPKVPKEWTCLADGDSDEWTWVRRTDVPDENRYRLFQFVNVIDMWNATGEQSGPRYCAELCEVHLDALSEKKQAQAWESCGWQPYGDHERTDEMLAEACYQCGCKAPMESLSSNNFREVVRGIFSYARQLDARNGANILRAAKLNMPVNAIGATALEYMTGDMDSAFRRAVAGQTLAPNTATVPSASILRWEPPK